MSERCEECGSELAGEDGTTWPVHCPVCAERISHQVEVSQLQAEIERLRTTVAEQQSDIAWMRNRIAELHAVTAAGGESDGLSDNVR